jgi:predicted deacylase
MGLWDGAIDMMDIETFNCNETATVKAQRGGYMETIVELEGDVKEGAVLG